jgi:hypothetical protein
VRTHIIPWKISSLLYVTRSLIQGYFFLIPTAPYLVWSCWIFYVPIFCVRCRNFLLPARSRPQLASALASLCLRGASPPSPSSDFFLHRSFLIPTSLFLRFQPPPIPDISSPSHTAWSFIRWPSLYHLPAAVRVRLGKLLHSSSAAADAGASLLDRVPHGCSARACFLCPSPCARSGSMAVGPLPQRQPSLSPGTRLPARRLPQWLVASLPCSGVHRQARPQLCRAVAPSDSPCVSPVLLHQRRAVFAPAPWRRSCAMPRLPCSRRVTFLVPPPALPGLWWRKDGRWWSCGWGRKRSPRVSLITCLTKGLNQRPLSFWWIPSRIGNSALIHFSCWLIGRRWSCMWHSLGVQGIVWTRDHCHFRDVQVQLVLGSQFANPPSWFDDWMRWIELLVVTIVLYAIFYFTNRLLMFI